MGWKRKKDEVEGEDGFAGGGDNQRKRKKATATATEPKEKREILPSMIKNKEKRSAVHAKLKQQKKLEKRKKLKDRDAAEKRALELGEEV